MTIQYPVRNRSEWIMRLLYAPDSYGRNNTPIYGRTRMMKACFLLDRNLEDKFDVETGFSFEPDKYGPFDEGVYSALQLLENEGELSIVPPEDHAEKYDSRKYQLTSQGEQAAEDLFENIPDGQKELIIWVRNEHAMKKLGHLLNYVYTKYPEMTTASELV